MSARLPLAAASRTPRPDRELAELERIWQPPRGLRLVTAVNNTYIGLFYVGASLFFFLVGGLLAALMRTQLAFAGNDVLGQDAYNQVFTMHGTIMMFLFAVPAVEAMGVYLLPGMLGARDLPFPRLSAYAFWAYFAGGLLFVCSLFFGVAPRGGWFMYPPLTDGRYSPGIDADFWLLGIGFIEISAIAGAIEMVVGILRTRAPGMSLDKLPIFAWAMLVFAAMIVVGFPAVILGTALLELERAFQWPFFDPTRGGDPLLWQHLFWFFGHPEVYIIFVPAAGFVSTILPTMAGVPLASYRLVVLALVATGFLSVGVWVHHMFATGISPLAVSFFSASSMAVALPSGIQVFAWIATLARGRVGPDVPTLFLLGFLFVFTLGGLTGVMVGLVPFDWQVHDTYFVVAHFHYVLIGGMVFPFFAALYYWIPTVSRPLSERVGRWVFGLMFVGFNVAFFPMHVTGLEGMPRRVWTYRSEQGWEGLNLLSTAGAYVLAAGVLVFVIDLVRRFRPGIRGGAGNVWSASTLEWLPTETYGIRSIPPVAGRDPLWEEPDLGPRVAAGEFYLPGAPTGQRETLVTSAVDARIQHVITLPGPGWSPLLAAVLTALAFFGLTLRSYPLAYAAGGLAVLFILVWTWSLDRSGSLEPVDVGGGLRLPVSPGGTSSHAGWAAIVLILVAAFLFGALLFSYGFLWTSSPEVWPDASGQPVAPALFGWASVAALVASAALVWLADRALRAPRAGGWRERVALLGAAALLVASVWLEVHGHREAGLRPTASSYGAVVYTLIALQGFWAAVLAIMALYTAVRSACGLLDWRRRATFDALRLLWLYAVAQGAVAVAVIHLGAWLPS